MSSSKIIFLFLKGWREWRGKDEGKMEDK